LPVNRDDLVLRTERLVLRPLEAGDVDLIWPDISDPEISRHMAWEAHSDRAQTLEFLKAEEVRIDADRGVTWAIFLDGEFCGITSIIGLVRRHRALTYNKAELAYWLGTRHQGKGIATEAVGRTVDYAFEQLRLHKLFVSHFSVNDASKKLILRLGFRFVGVQRQEFQKNGVWYDHVLYELLESEHTDARRRAE
jgi:ribosomal-protein-alanine N-acetyltransferase